MHDEHQIQIWFFIGGLLLIYGLLITAAGFHALVVPPPEESRVALYYSHSDICWGTFMSLVGLFYCARYIPFRGSQ
jgi:hypothetical protein